MSSAGIDSAGSGKYVRIDQQGDAVVVSPLFTFASFTEADLAAEWNAVQHEIDAPDVKHVIVDLGEIPYFGSTVLEWMVQMWKRAKAKGGQPGHLQLLENRPRSAARRPLRHALEDVRIARRSARNRSAACRRSRVNPRADWLRLPAG